MHPKDNYSSEQKPKPLETEPSETNLQTKPLKSKQLLPIQTIENIAKGTKINPVEQKAPAEKITNPDEFAKQKSSNQFVYDNKVFTSQPDSFGFINIDLRKQNPFVSLHNEPQLPSNSPIQMPKSHQEDPFLSCIDQSSLTIPVLESDSTLTSFSQQRPIAPLNLRQQAKKKELSDSQLISEGICLNDLIQDFFILSPTKSELIADEQPSDLKYYFSFQLSQNGQSSGQISQDLVSLIVSGPQRARQCLRPYSLQKISEVLFERQGTYRNCEFFHLTTLSNEDKTPFKLLHPSSQSTEVLEEANPDSLFYFYCAKYEDFFIERISEGQGAPFDTMRVISFPRYYVFKTIYPFSVFFHGVLRQLVPLNHKQRLDKLAELIALGPECNFLEFADADGAADMERIFLGNALRQLSAIKLGGNFRQLLELHLPEFSLQFALPPRESLYLSPVEDCLGRILALFSFEEFLLVYATLAAEGQLIVVSGSLRKLSACISSFLALLHPQRWQHYVVYNMPRDRLDFMNSPFPIIVGVHKESRSFLKEDYGYYKETERLSVTPGTHSPLFLFLDEMAFEFDKGLIGRLELNFTGGFIEKIKRIFKSSLNGLSSDFIDLKKSRSKKKDCFVFVKKNRYLLENYIDKFNGLKIKAQKKSAKEKIMQIRAKEIFNEFRLNLQFKNFKSNSGDFQRQSSKNELTKD